MNTIYKDIDVYSMTIIFNLQNIDLYTTHSWALTHITSCMTIASTIRAFRVFPYPFQKLHQNPTLTFKSFYQKIYTYIKRPENHININKFGNKQALKYVLTCGSMFGSPVPSHSATNNMSDYIINIKKQLIQLTWHDMT